MIRCQKCQGLLIDESITDHSTNPPTRFRAVSCVNCGFFMDELMAQNQGAQRKMRGKPPANRNIGTQEE